MIKAVSSLTEKQKKDIWELVKASDQEFYPPLSSREYTTQNDLTNQAGDKEPTLYFEALMKQSFILCIRKGEVIGFLSFIPDYHLTADEKLDLECDYVSTIIVSQDHRRKGYSAKMYRKLFTVREGKTVATRTWSQNLAHITLLEKEGFRLILTIKDDRGEGVDTVYYLRGEQK